MKEFSIMYDIIHPKAHVIVRSFVLWFEKTIFNNPKFKTATVANDFNIGF